MNLNLYQNQTLSAWRQAQGSLGPISEKLNINQKQAKMAQKLPKTAPKEPQNHLCKWIWTYIRIKLFRHDSRPRGVLGPSQRNWILAKTNKNGPKVTQNSPKTTICKCMFVCLFVCLFVTEATQFCVTAGSTLILKSVQSPILFFLVVKRLLFQSILLILYFFSFPGVHEQNRLHQWYDTKL